MEQIFLSFPTLETERLRLRQIVPEDAAALLDIFSRDEVTRFYDLYPFTELADVEDMIEFFSESYELEKGIRWGIARKKDNRLIGTCGFVWLRTYRGEIGYELHPDLWRRGIMREALGALVEFAFDEMGLNRIEAQVMVENASSAKLLHSLGFVEEGVLRQVDYFKDQFHDMRLFALLETDIS